MSRHASQRGFSLIELMMVLTILGILARLSMPVYQGIRRDALALQVAGDFNTVRAAAIAQCEATGSYAPDATTGAAPSGMAPFLPRGFSFTKPEYQLDWENWTVADTTDGSATTGSVVALTVVTPDPQVGLRVLHTLGRNCTHWTVDDASTFVIMSTLEAPH
jgi:prepilin-type N-terminal cleavage/methylation domain-containing protein